MDPVTSCRWVIVLVAGCEHGFGGVLFRRHPADQQSGGLQVGEGIRGLGVVGEVDRRVGGHDVLVGYAQQQVTLMRRESGEHLAGDAVDRAVRSVPARRRGGIRRGRHGPGGEDDGSRPTLGLSRHGFDELRRAAARVLGNQHGGLLVVHPEQVSPQHGEVTEQLGYQAAQRQVPARDQQQAQPLRRLAQVRVEQPQSRRGQCLGIVENDQLRTLLLDGFVRSLSCCVEQSPHLARVPRPVGMDPDGGADVPAGTEPAAHAERLAGSYRRDERGHPLLSGYRELLPQTRTGNVQPRQPRGTGQAEQASSA